MALARAMAEAALLGVGDPALGEWQERGETAYHVRRRLSEDEVRLARGLTVRDVRGTPEERRRMAELLAEAPQLRGRL